MVLSLALSQGNLAVGFLVGEVDGVDVDGTSVGILVWADRLGRTVGKEGEGDLDWN